jgi:hypothetical protein
MRKHNSLIEKISCIFIWIAILMAFPFSIAQAYNLPAKALITFSFLILFLIAIIFIEKIKMNMAISIIFLIQLVMVLILYFLHTDSSYTNLFLQLSISLIIYIILNNYVNQDVFIKRLMYFILIMSVLGVITFILCIAFNVSYFSEFKNPDGRTGYNFILSFTNTFFDINTAKIIRPAGFFDEPGTLAFYLIIAIILNDLTISNKTIRILLFFCGVFTLSVAFYAISTLYMLLRFRSKYIKKTLFFSTITIIIGMGIYSQLDESKKSILYGYTFERIGSFFSAGNGSSSNYFKGDNRSDLINLSKEAIKQSPIIGVGISYASKPGTPFFGKFMGANFLGIFAVHGLLGGLILSLHILYYGWVSFRTNRFGVEIKSFIIYFLLLLQRPDYIGGILPYISVIALIYVTKNYYKIHEQNLNYNSSL